jgi:hypothetical protein
LALWFIESRVELSESQQTEYLLSESNRAGPPSLPPKAGTLRDVIHDHQPKISIASFYRSTRKGGQRAQSLRVGLPRTKALSGCMPAGGLVNQC